MNKNKLFNIIQGLVFIIFGVILWNSPTSAIILYSMYLGFGALIFVGMSFLYVVFNTNMRPIPIESFAISIFACIIIFLLPVLTITFVIWGFIIVFLVSSIYFLYRLIISKTKTNILYFAVAILAVLLGLAMLLNPTLVGNTFSKILSIFIILNGISYMFPETVTMKNIKK